MSTSALKEARVELWRFERLLQAQCPAPAAMALATRRDVDLHPPVGLLEVGSPSLTIPDILR